jgi:hypothetical protein
MQFVKMRLTSCLNSLGRAYSFFSSFRFRKCKERKEGKNRERERDDGGKKNRLVGLYK